MGKHQNVQNGLDPDTILSLSVQDRIVTAGAIYANYCTGFASWLSVARPPGVCRAVTADSLQSLRQLCGVHSALRCLCHHRAKAMATDPGPEICAQHDAHVHLYLYRRYYGNFLVATLQTVFILLIQPLMVIAPF